jgi:hypothetical protein
MARRPAFVPGVADCRGGRIPCTTREIPAQPTLSPTLSRSTPNVPAAAARRVDSRCHGLPT